MRCDNHLCIYEENGFCFYMNVRISNTGTCKNCTFPKIDEKLLADAKMQAIKDLIIK